MTANSQVTCLKLHIKLPGSLNFLKEQEEEPWLGHKFSVKVDDVEFLHSQVAKVYRVKY